MIYILDDSPAMLEATQRALGGLGAILATSQWSELSNRLLRAPATDLLVCDLNMPGMSGAEFCRIIRRYNSEVRIVIFTDAAEKAPREIVDAVVSKVSDGFAVLRQVVSDLTIQDLEPPEGGLAGLGGLFTTYARHSNSNPTASH